MQHDDDFLPAATKIFSVHQRLATSGARSAHVFALADATYLAVPQLAEDIPEQDPHMNAGNADVNALLYRWEDGKFVEHRQLRSPSGEDALAFCSGDATYLAFANLRTGSGPYEFNTDSLIYREVDGDWKLDEDLPSFGAKQLCHFCIGEREFLALAQGIMAPGVGPTGHGRSVIFERIGGKWQEFQILGGRSGYNWVFFTIGEQHFLGYADHASPSVLYRWSGTDFVPYQTFSDRFGRAFLQFSHEGQEWLAFASIAGDSNLYRWNGELFEFHQVLGGPGGREFELIRDHDRVFLVRVCFIGGSPAEPIPNLLSQFYMWTEGKFEVLEEFPTFGGTDASYFPADGEHLLVVANSLTPDVRFRQDSVVYRLSLDNA